MSDNRITIFTSCSKINFNNTKDFMLFFYAKEEYYKDIGINLFKNNLNISEDDIEIELPETNGHPSKVNSQIKRVIKNYKKNPYPFYILTYSVSLLKNFEKLIEKNNLKDKVDVIYFNDRLKSKNIINKHTKTCLSWKLLTLDDLVKEFDSFEI